MNYNENNEKTCNTVRQKCEYKTIVIKVRKDDYVVKLLETYKKKHPELSRNKICINALFDWITMKLYKEEGPMHKSKIHNKSKSKIAQE